MPIVHGCGKLNLNLVIYDHHGASPVLKSVSVQGESTTLSSVTSTWARASDCAQQKLGKSIERNFVEIAQRMYKYMCRYQISIEIEKLSNLRVREVDRKVEFGML